MNKSTCSLEMSSIVVAARSWLLAILMIACVTGCTSTRKAVPAQHVESAEIPAMSGVRDWGGRQSDILQKSVVDALRQSRGRARGANANADSTYNMIALSGGGAYGAYGAGLLCGWTETGRRPEFQIVTGVSTGALMAPLVFLGSSRDEELKASYTTISTKDLIRPHSALEMLAGANSLADSTPLAGLIAKMVDEELLLEVANAHRAGRRLFVATTNLDARRSVIWDMGAIAVRGGPEGLKLFRDVTLASASIPVGFPPVSIEVLTPDGACDEMHVDGGVVNQVFDCATFVDLKAAMHAAGVAELQPRIYVVLTANVFASYQELQSELFPIITRSLDGLLANQGVGDIYRIYTMAKRDGTDFKCVSIPVDFKSVSEETFDQKEMNLLFDLGYTNAKAGDLWDDLPPGLRK